MGFKLIERNGEVNYLTIQGGTLIRHHTPINTALWTCEHNKPVAEALPGHPEYCVHVGEFFLEGVWDKPTRRRKKDEVCE